MQTDHYRLVFAVCRLAEFNTILSETRSTSFLLWLLQLLGQCVAVLHCCDCLVEQIGWLSAIGCFKFSSAFPTSITMHLKFMDLIKIIPA